MLAVASQEYLTVPPLPTDSDVIFLSSFDGADGAQHATDRSPVGATIQFFGTEGLDTAIKEFGTSSLRSPGTVNSGIQCAANALYTLVTSNFTVEGFIYFASNPIGHDSVIAGVFSSIGGSSTSQWALLITSSGSIRFAVFKPAQSVVYCDAPHGMVAGQFYHVAVSRANYTLRIFINGVMIASEPFFVTAADVNTTSAVGLTIGCDWDLQSARGLLGNIDEVRITRGSWYRFDTGFTPPAAPFGMHVPSLFVDPDVFYSPRISPYGMKASLFVDDDVFYTPAISPRHLFPSLVVDSDVFSAPKVAEASTWSVLSGFVTLSGGNLIATMSSTTSLGNGAATPAAAVRSAGFPYFEITATTQGGAAYGFGISNLSGNFNTLATTGANAIMLLDSGHVLRDGSDLGALFAAMSDGDVFGFAVDLFRGLLWIRKVSGTPSNWNGSVTDDPVAKVGGINLVTGPIIPVCSFGGAGGTAGRIITANFGQSGFVGALPTGFERGWVGDN